MSVSLEFKNPFKTRSALDLPLSLATCRQIRAAALRRSLDTNSSIANPLRREVAEKGMSVLIPHPADARRIFAGLNTRSYQFAIALYCDRLGRSVDTVHKIMAQLALAAQKAPVSYDAIWSVCQYAHQRRAESLAVRIEAQQTTWYAETYSLNFTITDAQKNPVIHPRIAYIAQTAPRRVLAFELVSARDASDKINQRLLYTALVAQRKPGQYSPGGLVWLVPTHLVNWRSGDVALLAQELGVNISAGLPPHFKPLSKTLAGWDKDLAGRTLSAQQAKLIFDQYLKRTLGYAPLQMQATRNKVFAQSISYNRDPVWQLPPLRMLLPAQPSAIAADTSVELDGLHYEHPFLSHWRGHQVNARRSNWAEATAWIYLDNEILCEAHARELRRSDGTYRSWR